MRLSLAFGGLPPGLTQDQLAGLVYLEREAAALRRHELARAVQAAFARD